MQSIYHTSLEFRCNADLPSLAYRIARPQSWVPHDSWARSGDCKSCQVLESIPFRCATSPRVCECLEVETMSIASSCIKQIRCEGRFIMALFPRADIDDLSRSMLMVEPTRGSHRFGLRIVASARVSNCHNHKRLDVHIDGAPKLHDDLDAQSGVAQESFTQLHVDFVLLVLPATSAGISLCTCMIAAHLCKVAPSKFLSQAAASPA